MAQNNLPRKRTALFTLAESVIDGLTTQGANLNIKQNTAAATRADLDIARAANTAFNTARAAKTALTAATTAADRDAKVFLTIARDSLKPALGPQWSTGWADAGFVDGSLAVPEKADDRMEHVMHFKTYLTAHPTREVPPLNVTAAHAATLHTRISDARAALNAHLGEMAAKKIERNGAVEALRRRLRGTIAEIGQLLPADSTDWHAFGLQPPASAQTPDVPDGLVLTANPAEPAAVYLDWDDAPRAEHYRVWRQLPGEAEPVGLASVDESELQLDEQPRGQVLKFSLSAVNDAGESLRGAVSEITLP